MRRVGLQESSSARMNARPAASKSTGIPRKRSRSEIADEVEREMLKEAKDEDATKWRFPERAKQQNRTPQLDIDYRNLPSFSQEPTIPEVSDGARREMSRLELEYAPDADYLNRQPSLNARMRAVLIDWMFEVGQEYGLKRDTLHFSINFVDRFLSRQENPVARSELQLIGVTALWVASKMEEILPPPVSDFAAATDGGCLQAQIIETEGRMVQSLDWKLLPCTAFAFANYYLQALAGKACRRIQGVAARQPAAVEPKFWMVPSVVPHNQLNRVMEVLDLSLLDVDSLCFAPSVLAATAVLSLVEKDNTSFFSVADVEEVTQYKKSQLEDCIEWFAFALELAPAPPFQHRQHILNATPAQEVHTLQRHNPEAIREFKNVNSQRGGYRHPAAQRHLDKVRNGGGDDESVAEDSDEEFELTALGEQQARGHPGFRNVMMDPTRAFSPMTQVSMALENTSLAQPRGVPLVGLPVRRIHPAPEDGQDSAVSVSPQRRIHFDDETDRAKKE